MLIYPVYDGNEKLEYENLIQLISLTNEPPELPPYNQLAWMQNSNSSSNSSIEKLKEIQCKIFDLAKKFNYPHKLDSSKKQLEFDWEVGKLLYDQLNITPSISATLELWLFFNLKMAPQIIYWRWGNSIDHYCDSRRNYFGTQWWRYYLFYEATIKDLDAKVSVSFINSIIFEKTDENQIIALYERSNSRGLPGNLFYILKWFYEKSPGLITAKKKELFSSVVKEYKKELGFRNYFVLSENDKKTLFSEAFDTCIKSFSPFIEEDTSEKKKTVVIKVHKK